MSSWSLKSVGHVKESSSLYTLSPMLRNGLIEVSSRIKQVMIPDAMKHPVLLPQEHRLSRMITEEAHNDAHLGLRRVLSNLRKQFWIIGTQNLIKKVKHQYVHATNSIDLPRQPSIRLFTNVGIDVFGQFLVKQGQSEVKQYGVVFTCLSVHAIHLKKLTCLDTDFFINAFVRYGSRRGYPKRSGVTMAPFETRLPKKVWSHNGTNLVNGHAELVRCLQQLDKDRTLRTARRHKVEFF